MMVVIAPSAKRLVLAVWLLVTINVSSTYTTFRKRLSLPTSSTNLEQFCETVWHVAHHNHPPPHKAPLEPGQECDAPFPNLSPAHAIHTVDEEEWSQDLMKKYRVVQQELQAYLSTTTQTTAAESNDWSTSSTSLCSDTSGFSKLTLLTSEGTPTPVGCTYFSQTLEALLRNVPPLAPRPVCINGQGPQTGLAPHSDNMNFILTCHLGVEIPSGATCSMTIKEGGSDNSEIIKYHWKEGELVICDTSFVHWTRNDSTSETRYVLSFAIWHPKLTHEEREGILQIHKALGQEQVASS